MLTKAVALIALALAPVAMTGAKALGGDSDTGVMRPTAVESSVPRGPRSVGRALGMRPGWRASKVRFEAFHRSRAQRRSVSRDRRGLHELAKARLLAAEARRRKARLASRASDLGKRHLAVRGRLTRRVRKR